MARALCTLAVAMTVLAGCGIKDDPDPMRTEAEVRTVPASDSKVGTAALIDGEIDNESM